MSANTIDLGALAAQVSTEVDKMSPEDVRKQLLDMKVRQKTSQKKQYNSDSAKKAAAKQREKAKALQARAKALGIYDDVNEKAEAEAQTKFEQWKADQGGEDEDEDQASA